MGHSILDNQKKILLQFSSCTTQESKYKKIIEMGSSLPPFDPLYKTSEHLVRGCQSLTYLYHTVSEGKLYFFAYSEALISAGLASLLIQVYSGQTPEDILRTPPEFIKELELGSLLSPGRSNGLIGMYTRIREIAVKALQL